MKKILKKFFSDAQRKALRKAQLNLISKWYSGDLNKLATLHNTDKWNSHWYTQHYDRHFRPMRKKKLTVLEIGVGGYERPEWGGESLRMWKQYFPNSRIYALDIFDKSPHNEHRIKIFKGSQVDKEFLESIHRETGDFDIIIDDGSHMNEHVIETFKILFPKLKQGGVYAVEDMQTSYWPKYGGDSEDLRNENTMMNFFKAMADNLNYQEIVKEGYEPSYYDQNIVSLHFYHNMAFVHKNVNNEGSNLVKNNRFIDPEAGRIYD